MSGRLGMTVRPEMIVADGMTGTLEDMNGNVAIGIMMTEVVIAGRVVEVDRRFGTGTETFIGGRIATNLGMDPPRTAFYHHHRLHCSYLRAYREQYLRLTHRRLVYLRGKRRKSYRPGPSTRLTHASTVLARMPICPLHEFSIPSCCFYMQLSRDRSQRFSGPQFLG